MDKFLRTPESRKVEKLTEIANDVENIKKTTQEIFDGLRKPNERIDAMTRPHPLPVNDDVCSGGS